MGRFNEHEISFSENEEGVGVKPDQSFTGKDEDEGFGDETRELETEEESKEEEM